MHTVWDAIWNIAQQLQVPISLIALFASITALWITRAQRNIQIAHNLHQALFKEVKDYRVLYLLARKHDYYFSNEFSERGKPGNFIGSDKEPDIDILLERLNFICMWLLRSAKKDSPAEHLFRKHIHDVYKSPFFRDYFSYLANVEDEKVSGTYFSFIHQYAQERLNMERPNEDYPKSPKNI